MIRRIKLWLYKHGWINLRVIENKYCPLCLEQLEPKCTVVKKDGVKEGCEGCHEFKHNYCPKCDIEIE